MAKGTIKSVKTDRGFGFIRLDPRDVTPGIGRPDVFFHFRQLDNGLPFDESIIGQPVEFAIEDSEKGPRATDVRPIW